MSRNCTIPEICIVDITHMSIYDFVYSENKPEEALKNANNKKEESIKTWTSHCKNYPDAEQFKKYLKREQETEYVIMTYDEFAIKEKEYYMSLKMTEITEEVFEEMLNVLPPIKWCTINGVEMFCMSEMLTGTFTSQYLHDRNTNKFYHKTVDIADKNTWGYNFI